MDSKTDFWGKTFIFLEGCQQTTTCCIYIYILWTHVRKQTSFKEGGTKQGGEKTFHVWQTLRTWFRAYMFHFITSFLCCQLLSIIKMYSLHLSHAICSLCHIVRGKIRSQHESRDLTAQVQTGQDTVVMKVGGLVQGGAENDSFFFCRDFPRFFKSFFGHIFTSERFSPLAHLFIWRDADSINAVSLTFVEVACVYLI